MKKAFKLEGEICANCAAKIEHAIEQLDGVKSVRVNAMTLRFILDAEDGKFAQLADESVAIFGRIEPDCTVIR